MDGNLSESVEAGHEADPMTKRPWAIIRVLGPDAHSHSATVKGVVATREEAEDEMRRLNDSAIAKGSRYDIAVIKGLENLPGQSDQ